jgi:nucleotide-binding universal stress UspA family protein
VETLRIILFAADFSDNSIAAFRVACSVSIEKTTRLIVLHVVEPDWAAKGLDYLGPASVPPSETESLHEFLSRRLSEVYAPIHPLDVEYRISEGPAASEIIHIADEVGANLIAMGTHGRTGLRRLLTGSIAAAVLGQAHCPVLALRSVSGRAEYKAGEIRVIVHPTDFSQVSEAACGVARSLARDHGARLVILHVAPLDIYLEGRFAADLDPADRGRALDEMRKRLDGPELKYPVETLLTRGREAEAIRQVAQDVACDLIVMGTHQRTGLGRLLMGSTAESVLSRADCPVLVVKLSPIEMALAPAGAAGGAGIAL